MLIDLHLHTSEYSPCSKVSLEEIIVEAKQKGLDGICITDHDNFLVEKLLEDRIVKDLFIIVGVEVLTYEGDILVFGVKDLPKEKVTASQLVNYVSEKGGISIAAHPFRDNDRGIKENIRCLAKLNFVEGFNGNTSLENNLKAVNIANEIKQPIVAASDAHNIKQVGCYATYFDTKIKTEKEFIQELVRANVKPMKYNYELKKYKEIR
jgi:predicted metal-dependent phosphoesterase TrpH